MLKLLFDPKVFNCLLLGLSILATLRWAIAGRVADTCYWAAASLITFTVTFLYRR